MNKYIIVKDSDGKFVMRYANTDYHHRLVGKKDSVFGGGMFDLNAETSVMTLYGKSDDFGEPRWRDIERWNQLKKSTDKIHVSEELDGWKIRCLNGYDKEWNPIYADITDKFIFDEF